MSRSSSMKRKRVVIVGCGFAGKAAADELVRHPDIHVTLIDKNNYYKFTPLLYQVATSALSVDNVATSIRHCYQGKRNIDVKMANVISVDAKTCTVQTEEGESYSGDYLILAAGSVVNFFDTKGANAYSFPLYGLSDAERIRSRILAVFEDADRNPKLIEHGALNFVIVGAGPTGSEVAGAIADMLNIALPNEFTDLAVRQARVYLVDHSKTVLSAFSESSQKYAAEILSGRGVQLELGVKVEEVSNDFVLLSNGEKILTKTVIWAGGVKASTLADASGVLQGHGGRIEINENLSVDGHPNIYAVGDFANIAGSEGKPLPQLGSVAMQSGKWAAKNILAQIKGEAEKPFKYVDKGIMAMIGRNAAVAEIGKKRRRLKGTFAYFTWLLVHAALFSNFRQKVGAFLEWGWDYFGHMPAVQILDGTDSARIQWNEEEKTS